MKNKVIYLFFGIFLLLNNLYSQTKLYTDIPVSDFGTNNRLGPSNKTINTAVDNNGNIYVVYTLGAELRLSKSIDGGLSYLPSNLIANTFFNVTPEINIHENGTIYIAWTLNTSIYFTYSIDEGTTFTTPKNLAFNIAGSINIASYKNYVYLSNQLAQKILVNSNFGIGDFIERNTNFIKENSDLFIDKNGVVLVPIDNPKLEVYESTNQAQSLLNRNLTPSIDVFYTSYAFSDNSSGSFIFVGGGNSPNLTENISTKGYKINTITNEVETIILGDNKDFPYSRYLFADNNGSLIDGYKDANGDLMIRISTDQGLSFKPPINVAKGNIHKITKSPITDNIIVVYEKEGKIFSTIFSDIIRKIKITTNTPISYCSNQSFDIQFQFEGVFSQNNTLIALLSDENGDFSNATQIGMVTTSLTKGIINVTLPSNLIASNLYRIQLESLTDFVKSNSLELTISDPEIVGKIKICNGESTQLTSSSPPRNINPWVSSNTNIATINDNGLVTSISYGITDITFYSDKGCSKKIQLEVFELPTITQKVELKQCDNADINGFSIFNLNEVKSKIVANPENFTITFFESKTDAESNTNAISNATNYQNKTVSNSTIWARVENVNSCFEVSEVNLIVSTTEIPTNFSKTFYQCDDGGNLTDGIAKFNFSSVNQEVTNLFPANQQLEISYYQNEIDALLEQNKITNIANYQNTNSPYNQTLYIRVESLVDNACIGLGAHINLVVEKNPVANAVSIDPQCDHDGDGFFAFDTSTIQNQLIGNQTNISITYIDADGNPLPSPLPNPFNTKTQTITARLENANSMDSDGKCFVETQLFFEVIKVPVANAITPLELCDDDTDGTMPFDTSTIQASILGAQTGMRVRYFYANNVELSSPLPNPFVSNSQTIRVRVENPAYDVCFSENFVQFIVHPKPTFELQANPIICVGNATNFEINTINLSGNFTFVWEDANGILPTNASQLSISKGGTYKVKAIAATGCESDVQEIFIQESSISNLLIGDLIIQDDSDNNFIKINNQNIGLGDYEFQLKKQDGTIVYSYQSDLNFQNLEGGNYIVTVRDNLGCGLQNFEVSLISFPKFFSPNADGTNDYWQVRGLDKSFYKSGEIRIFNRYGSLMKKFTINDLGWDDTYNGKSLEGNDFWFQITLINQNNEVIHRTGNFSLIR